jgi:hypothetical protein
MRDLERMLEILGSGSRELNRRQARDRHAEHDDETPQAYHP